MHTTALAIAAALFAAVRAQDIPANTTESQLEYVEAQYNASGFDTAIGSSLAFEIPLDAAALLTVYYDNAGVIENGKDYAATAVASFPTFYATPTAQNASQFGTSDRFTLMLADASAIDGPDAEGDYRHYLANGVSFAEVTSADNYTQVLNAENATIITHYAGPGPLEGSGTHRYAWLLFAQNSSFTAPQGLSTEGTSPSHWNVTAYVQESGLGPLVAASFFTVTASGTASFSQGATSSIASSAFTQHAATGANAAKSSASTFCTSFVVVALSLAAYAFTQ